MLMCSTIINLSEQGLQTIDNSYGEATSIILDKNDIRDLCKIAFMTKIQQLSIANNSLKDMHGLENISNITILNLAYNDISKIDCLDSLTHLTWLNLCGNRIKRIENFSHNLALKHLDLSENEIKNLEDLSHLSKLKTLLLHCNFISTLEKANTFLPKSLCILSLAENRISALVEFKHLSHLRSLLQLSIQGNLCLFNRIPHCRSYILSILPNLSFIDGNYPSQDERSLGELISQCRPDDDESALINFLINLKPEAIRQGEFRFRKQSEIARRITNSRAALLKRGFSAANEMAQNVPRSNTPSRWLQRARSEQNIVNLTEKVNSSSVGSLTESLYGFHRRQQISAASCNAIPTYSNTGTANLLRSDSVFIPIGGEGEYQVEIMLENPEKTAQTLPADLPSDPTDEELLQRTKCQGQRYSTSFLRSLLVTSRNSQKASSLDAKRVFTSNAIQKPTLSTETKLKAGQFAASGYRRKFSRGALSCIQRQGKLSDEEEEEKPATGTISGKADQTSIEDGPEVLSSLSEHTFNVDPSFLPAGSPGGVEADIRSLRRQLEEFRALSARQERDRLQQADEIQRLAEEIQNLKVWKASILQGKGIIQSSAAGVCKRRGNLSESSDSPSRMRNVSPSMSTLADINRSTLTEDDDAIPEVFQKEEEEGNEVSDQDEIEIESPFPRPSSSDLNGTLLTANLSTDSLETGRSRLSTPLGFGNVQIYSANMDDGQLVSESTLVPTDVATPV